MKRVTILVGQAGWAVYFDRDAENFYPYNANEPYRMATDVLKALGIKIDDVIRMRQEKFDEEAKKLDKTQPIILDTHTEKCRALQDSLGYPNGDTCICREPS